MNAKRGRVLRGAEVETAKTLAENDVPTAIPAGRVVPREVVDAAARAKEIVDRAESRAAEIVGRAERDGASARLAVEEAGRADGAARVAAHAVALASAELAADERALDRTIELAKILAERLLGRELSLRPDAISDLAREVLAEGRARRVTVLEVHPADAPALERLLAELGAPGARVEPATDLARGGVRVCTEHGVLEADLAPRIDRLAERLRESLGRASR